MLGGTCMVLLLAPFFKAGAAMRIEFNSPQKLFADIRHAAKQWSFFHWVLEAGLSLLIAPVLGFVTGLPWWQFAMLVLGVAVCAFAIIEWIRRAAVTVDHSHDRIERARYSLTKAIVSLPNESPLGINISAMLNPLSMPDDWRAISTARIRAVVNHEVLDHYLTCIEGENPVRTVRCFLEELRDNLSLGDLRSARNRSSKRNAPAPR